MSHHATTWAYQQTLPCAHKFVLVSLADQEQQGRCFYAQKTLARKCGLSRQRVNEILKDLERDGYLTIETRTRPNGSNSSCMYWLNCPGEKTSEGKPTPIEGFVFIAEAEGDYFRVLVGREVERRLQDAGRFSEKLPTVLWSYPCDVRRARQIESIIEEQMAGPERGEWTQCDGEDLIRIANEACQPRRQAPPYESDEVGTPLSGEATGPVNPGDRPMSTQATTLDKDSNRYEGTVTTIPRSAVAREEIASRFVEETRSPQASRTPDDDDPGFDALHQAFLGVPHMPPDISAPRMRGAYLAIPAAERPPLDVMRRCVSLWASRVSAENRLRKPDDPMRVKHPPRWLRERCYAGLLTEATKSPPIAAHNPVDGAADSLGVVAIERMIAQGFTRAELDAWFGGATIDWGPPVTIRLLADFKLRWITNKLAYMGRLQRAFGEDVVIELAMRSGAA